MAAAMSKLRLKSSAPDRSAHSTSVSQLTSPSSSLMSIWTASISPASSMAITGSRLGV